MTYRLLIATLINVILLRVKTVTDDANRLGTSVVFTFWSALAVFKNHDANCKKESSYDICEHKYHREMG